MDADACRLQESGFINASHARTSNSNMSAQIAQSGSAVSVTILTSMCVLIDSKPPMAQQKLTAARAHELIKLQQVQTAHPTFEDQDDDMGDTFEENEYDAPIDSQDTDVEHNNVSDDEGRPDTIV
jgi:hypothetical protein